MTVQKFDLIVIGAGAAGLNVASFCNTIGLKVLLIEKEANRIGGDCLNYGCIPSKALLHAAREIYAARNASKYGLQITGVVNFADVRAKIEDAQETIRDHESVEYFTKKGLTVEIGEASFVNETTVAVGEKQFTAKKIVLALGARPRELDVLGVEDAEVHTNETIFALDRLPGRVVVLGGGPIGVELGQAFSMMGSEVTIVTRDDRLLVREDEEISSVLQKRLEDMGVALYFNTTPVEFQGRTRLVVEVAKSATQQIGYDVCISAIGRTFDFSALRLDTAKVFLNERGAIATNDYLQTTNPNIFAVGDCIGEHQFTHAAEVHAALVLGNMFKPKLAWKKLVTDHMGWVTFTDPEVATFGHSEKTLKEQGVPYEVVRTSFENEDRAITDEYRDGVSKLFVEKRSGTVLGGTMIARNAGEIIQELLLAQRHEMTLQQLFEKVYPYPTATRINRIAAQSFLGKKLTPSAKRLLRLLY